MVWCLEFGQNVFVPSYNQTTEKQAMEICWNEARFIEGIQTGVSLLIIIKPGHF